MFGSQQIGKLLIFLGLILVVLGGLFLLGDNIPFLGKLPGDIHIQKKSFNFYFPLTTCILLSLIISIILYLFRR
jgi:hypothetical protein